MMCLQRFVDKFPDNFPELLLNGDDYEVTTWEFIAQLILFYITSVSLSLFKYDVLQVNSRYD